ncbi:MAG: class I SAM-dependent methyltransferase [Deltaproteobacteria bacterium]|nr:class I SAM-dependent methyltransferase [Deltaproteobacteria bacterium]
MDRVTDRQCNACEGALLPGLASVQDPQSLEEFAIRRCASCGLGHTSPIPEDLGAYYGPAYYGKRHSFTDRYCLARRMRLLASATGRTGGKLLDVGCGDGNFLAAAKAAGWESTGTDIGGALENARSAGLDVYGSLDEAAAKGPFDAITMWHTLEHFTDPRATLEKVRSAIAKSGTLIVAVPDAAGLQASLFRGRWFHLDVPRHLYHFDRSALSSLLARVGFAPERWHHQEIENDVFGWMQSALNTVLPAPNVLFQSLTGKPSHGGAAQRALSYALGTALAPAALAATTVSAVTKRGAVLIAVCRPV